MDHPSHTSLMLTSPCLQEDGTPAFRPRCLEEFGASLPETLRIPGAMPSMRGRGSARWCLVLPEEATTGPSSADIHAALEPLLRLRRAGRPLTFRPREGIPLYDQVSQWEEQHADPLYKENVTLLLAGDLADLPFALQQVLGARHSIGRLSLASADTYATYAQKVVEAESGPNTEKLTEALLFGPAGDAATALTQQLLVAPIERVLRRKRSGLTIHTLLRDQAVWSTLFPLIEASASRSLWVLAGHGCEPKTWTASKLGLPFDHWKHILPTGFPGNASRILTQGVAILIACHSGGRTGLDQWSDAGVAAAPDPRRELLAPLPTALLSHPHGPLAVMAHLDRLFVIGYSDRSTQLPEGDFQPGVLPLHSLVEHLAAGETLSQALSAQRKTISRHGDELRRLLEHRQTHPGMAAPEENIHLARTWYRWYDAQSWVVMGDPASCLRGKRLASGSG